MKTTHKVIEIFDWFNNFNNTNIKISGETKEFVININNNILPHLLGLQYINNVNDSDESRVNDIANRINTLKEFMKNHEKIE